jgi:ubiquinone/menaquinone biosynthesis C-methylase UbiE
MTAANDEQIALWNGPSGDVWAAMQARLDNQLVTLGRATIDALAPRPGERIVDVGCGSGQSTVMLSERVAPGGHVLGVDVAAPLLAIARRRAESAGAGAVDFVEADAQVHRFEPDRDALYSRFGVMFFADPIAAFANLAGALRPRGRLAFVCWRRPDENPVMMAPLAAAVAAGLPPPDPTQPGAPGPFAFAEPSRIATILASAGFTAIEIVPHDERIGGNDLDATLDLTFHVGPLGRQLRLVPEARDSVVDAVRAALEPYVSGGLVMMPSATWIVTAIRSSQTRD